MKKLFTILACALFACMTIPACGGNAQAQTLYAHAQFGPNQTVDLLHARVVDMTPGAQKVIDVNGVVHIGAFPSDTDFINADFQQRYAALSSSPNVWYNVTAMTGARCVGNNSVLDWAVGGSQTVNDACQLYNLINGRSRR